MARVDVELINVGVRISRLQDQADQLLREDHRAMMKARIADLKRQQEQIFKVKAVIFWSTEAMRAMQALSYLKTSMDMANKAVKAWEDQVDLLKFVIASDLGGALPIQSALADPIQSAGEEGFASISGLLEMAIKVGLHDEELKLQLRDALQENDTDNVYRLSHLLTGGSSSRIRRN